MTSGVRNNHSSKCGEVMDLATGATNRAAIAVDEKNGWPTPIDFIVEGDTVTFAKPPFVGSEPYESRAGHCGGVWPTAIDGVTIRRVNPSTKRKNSSP